MDLLQTVAEHERLSEQIEIILSKKANTKGKMKNLRELSNSCVSLSSKAHADYYINQLQKARAEKVKRAMLWIYFFSYLTFTLLRIWWYYNPEDNPLPETNNTISDLIVFLFIITIVVVIIWGIISAAAKRRRR